MNETIKKERIKTLRWYDILLITVIMIGSGIYDSTRYFINLLRENNALIYVPDFKESDNYSRLVMQLVFLFAALAYLKWRNFDFGTWHVRISLKGVLQGLALFAAASLCMDILYWLAYYCTYYYTVYAPAPSLFVQRFMSIKPSLILYALLNGIYEELYFLGICLAVPHKHRVKAFLFSLLIRFSFHTYMGIYTALGIALVLGILYFVLYTKSKDKNLFPFFFSHVIADIFGLSILSYFFYQQSG